MIIWLLKKSFAILIGKLPEDTKRKLWLDFNELLKEAIKAGAEGAVAGAINTNKHR